jgi:multidrug resistance efflux pump
VRLDTTDARKQVEGARAALVAAVSRLALARQDAGQQVSRLRQLQALHQVSLHQLAAAQIQLRRQEALYRKDLVNREEVEVAREQVRAREAARDAAQARWDELKRVNTSLAIQAAQAEVEVAQARLAVAEQALERCTVRAPTNGRVLSVAIHRGEVIGPTSPPLLTFCPDRPFIVRAEVEQEFLDRVRVGMSARIRNEGAGDSSWSGTVVSVGNRFQHRQLRPDATQLSDVPTVECLIRLSPQHPPLRIGQRVVVSLLGKAD